MSCGEPLDPRERELLLDAWKKYRRALDRGIRLKDPMGGTWEYEEFRRRYVALAPEVMASLGAPGRFDVSDVRGAARRA